jgi:menaquinone-specific isochorismate synthase
LVSISTLIDPVDPLWIFSRLGHSLRFYWEQPDRGLAIAAAGSTESLRVDGDEDRYERTALTWRGLLEEAIVDAPADLEGVGPIFVGGYSFDSRPKGSALWRGFPAAKFFLPRFSVSGTLNGTWLTYNRVVTLGEETFEDLFIRSPERVGVGADGEGPGGSGGPFDQLPDIFTILREAESVERVYKEGIGENQARTYSRYARGGIAGSGNPHVQAAGRPTGNGLPDADTIGAVQSDQVASPEEWTSQVGATVQMIRDRRAEKVVLARRTDFECGSAFDQASILAHLRAEYPSATVFAVGERTKCFLGASPERLVRKDGAHLEVTCLAGSIGRSDDEEEDREKIAQLLASAKDRSEHDIVVRAIREALVPIADHLSGPEPPRIASFRNLHHLCTPVTATIKPRLGIVDAVAALHPTPAVGGFPRAQALEIIGETEVFDRGWFAGPIGWIDARGNGEFSVALRSGLVDGSRISLFAGCGIVRDSDAQQEWRETELKMRPMMSALGLT